MGRARAWISVGGAIALVLAGAVLGSAVDRQTHHVAGCTTAAGASVEDVGAGPDDILLTEQPWDGAVSVHIGQPFAADDTGRLDPARETEPLDAAVHRMIQRLDDGQRKSGLCQDFTARGVHRRLARLDPPAGQIRAPDQDPAERIGDDDEDQPGRSHS